MLELFWESPGCDTEKWANAVRSMARRDTLKAQIFSQWKCSICEVQWSSVQWEAARLHSGFLEGSKNILLMCFASRSPRAHLSLGYWLLRWVTHSNLPSWSCFLLCSDITPDLFYKRVPGYLENASLVLYIYKCSITRMVSLTPNSNDGFQTKENWLLDYPVLRPFIPWSLKLEPITHGSCWHWVVKAMVLSKLIELMSISYIIPPSIAPVSLPCVQLNSNLLKSLCFYVASYVSYSRRAAGIGCLEMLCSIF